MSTLLIDNYDSYTYNVFHLLAAVSGEEPTVVRNDIVSWKALSRWDFDAIVLSPGPGRPERWHDFGVCADILRFSEIPVLGVCLGHQGIGHMLNGAVRSAPVVMHGRRSAVKHLDSGLFEGIPQDFSVVRYHSLTVGNDLGPEGRVTAWTEDGIVMGIEHLHRPLWGVQFHPESVATEHGHRLFENFYALAREHRRRSGSRGTKPKVPASRAERPTRRLNPAGLRVLSRSISGEPSGERLFERLFGDCKHAFWLDSVDAPSRLARASYLGTSAGTERCVLEYDVERQQVTSQRADGPSAEPGSVFTVLDRELAKLSVETPDGLPEGLIGGFVGYLGYECKADCGSPNVHVSDMPDAVMMLANRVIAIDHIAHQTRLVALCGEDDAGAETWLDEAEREVLDLLSVAPDDPPAPMPETDG